MPASTPPAVLQQPVQHCSGHSGPKVCSLSVCTLRYGIVEAAANMLLSPLCRRLKRRPGQFWGFDTLDPDWLVRVHVACLLVEGCITQGAAASCA